MSIILIFNILPIVLIFHLLLFLCLVCLLLTFLDRFIIVEFFLVIYIRFDEIFTTFGLVIHNLMEQLMAQLTCGHYVLLFFIIIVRGYN